MKQNVGEKLISLFLVLIFCVFSMGFTVLYSSATEYTADGVHSFYIGSTQPKGVIAEFNEDFTVLSVFTNGKKSNGRMKDWSDPADENYIYNPVYEHADTLKSVIIDNGVVNLGKYMLYECSALESITLPDSLIRIGDSSLRKTGLTAISFPSKLKYIGERAFSGCHSLKGNIVIPDSVTGIGNYAFFNCDSVNGTLTIGSSVKELGAHAFDRCFRMSGSLSLPASLEYIGAYCFENCESLSGVLTLNEGLKHIGDGAFNHCYSFNNETLAIPSSLETIGGDTVYEVDAYTAVPLDPPQQYFNHSSHVFYDFANGTLREFTVGEGNTHFTAIDGVLFTEDMKRMIAYPPSKEGESYAIPEGVEIIDEMAFGRTVYSSAVNRLKNVTLPDSYIIKYDDDYPDTLNREAMCSLSSALYLFSSVENVFLKETNNNYKSVDGCIYSSDLKNLICVPSGKKGIVYVGSETEVIAYGAFAGCKSLDYAVIPDSVTAVSSLAFYNASGCNVIGYKDSAVDANIGCNVHYFGDLNNDGDINLSDYLCIIKHIENGFKLNEFQTITGDCNRDSSVDGFDLFYVDKLINGN